MSRRTWWLLAMLGIAGVVVAWWPGSAAVSEPQPHEFRVPRSVDAFDASRGASTALSSPTRVEHAAAWPEGVDAGAFLTRDVRGLPVPIRGGATRAEAEAAARECVGLREVLGFRDAGVRVRPRHDDGFLTGHVVRVNGSYTSSGRVLVHASEGGTPVFAIFNGGRYGVRLRPGRYTVSALAPEPGDRTAEVALAAAGLPAVEVDIVPGEVVSLDVRLGNERARVRARVRDASGPVPNAQMLIDVWAAEERGDDDEVVSPVTDAFGFVERLVTAGRHTVGFWAAGHVLRTIEVDLAPDSVVDLGEFTLDTEVGLTR